VLLPETTAGRPFAAIRPGDPVRVCASRVVAGPLSVDIVRHWRPRTARAAHGYDAGALAVLDATLPPLHDVGHAADELRSVLHAGRPTDIDLEHTIRAMLGLGGGLTPEGDDVLAGLLVGLGSRPRTRTLAARLASTVTRHAPGRTTLLSATLLKHAARGLAIPRLIDLVDALHPEGAAATARDAVVRLLAVGHTSGSALAHGVRAAATAHATTQHRSEVA
jgi:hypothetical protein